MKSRTSLWFATAAFSILVSAPMASAQGGQRSAICSEGDTVRIVTDVQKNIGGLTTLGVFDWIVRPLCSKAMRRAPFLSNDAGKGVKGIPGLSSVDNQIEVLPLSPNGDRVRAAV